MSPSENKDMRNNFIVKKNDIRRDKIFEWVDGNICSSSTLRSNQNKLT